MICSSSSELGDSFGASDEKNDCGSRKRYRARGVASESKAFKEKLRRGKLNDRFQELSVILEPGRPPKTDKAAILSNAMRMVIQLREEAQKLQESSENLQKKSISLKAEKNELRDEKHKLKAEKEKLDEQVRALSSQKSFMPYPMAMPTPFPPQQQVGSSKLVPIMSYPGVPMWQFMPQGAVDTSEDHVLRPPVA
ncbi:hypothetical protein Leryth_018723 [Lithospermum erythrorhizon]|nr:hypothetical protein Leryth_018723 [Lithospermum erythrorhizon]